jgi:hypothetical protein
LRLRTVRLRGKSEHRLKATYLLLSRKSGVHRFHTIATLDNVRLE